MSDNEKSKDKDAASTSESKKSRELTSEQEDEVRTALAGYGRMPEIEGLVVEFNSADGVVIRIASEEEQAQADEAARPHHEALKARGITADSRSRPQRTSQTRTTEAGGRTAATPAIGTATR